jgi:rhamnogalacturonan endolyase
MNKKLYRTAAIAVTLCSLSAWVQAKDVTLKVDGKAITLDNGLAHFSFAEDASAKVVGSDATNLVDALSGTGRDPSRFRSFYLDYHAGGVTEFKPETLEVLEQTPARAHIRWVQHQGKLDLEYHLVMVSDAPGLYSYVVAHNANPSPLLVSELRTIYRFNAKRMEHLYTAQGASKPPLYGELEKMPFVQDETWRLPDGSAYTKYNLVDYLRHNDFWGSYGNGYGVWFIPINHDYYSGGPLKQDLMVHQDAIILNYMTGAHMGTGDMIAPSGWSKVYGPWFVYLNKGNDEDIIRDAAVQAKTQQKLWPLTWVNDEAGYPLKRANVAGSIGGRSKETFNVTLTQQEGDPEQQTLGYAYATQSEANGSYHFDAVRPGSYWLTVYSANGYDQGTLYQQEVKIEASTQKLASVTLPPSGNYLWHLGFADRTSTGFKFSDQPRNSDWPGKMPATLDFHVGTQTEADWCYAQTKPGDWTITYTEAHPEATRRLNLAFAATSASNMQKPTQPKMSVLVNGEAIGELAWPNDKTIYRGGMKNGQYRNASLDIPAGLLKKGDNVITLRNYGGSFMYDAINLEAR